jgi:hypothetical protein
VDIFSLEGDDLLVFAEPVINPTVLHVVGAGHVALATGAAFTGSHIQHHISAECQLGQASMPRRDGCILTL